MKSCVPVFHSLQQRMRSSMRVEFRSSLTSICLDVQHGSEPDRRGDYASYASHSGGTSDRLPGCDGQFNQIAVRRELIVIEDAACAIGSEYKGERLGQPHSQMACFSFHPRKILTTGEGGIITTADADAGARLRRLRQHGMTVSDVARHSSSKVMIERYDEVGYNYRMTDLQAAVGLVQLQRLESMLTGVELWRNDTRQRCPGWDG